AHMVCSREFFLSSRRRHTMSKRDWSSDVCSSDLGFEVSKNKKTNGNKYCGSTADHSLKSRFVMVISFFKRARTGEPVSAAAVFLCSKFPAVAVPLTKAAVT